MLALKGVACGLDTYTDVSLLQVREKSIALCDLFIRLLDQECFNSDLQLLGLKLGEQRGSQVSIRFKLGYALIRALIDRGVVGDFRAPDLMRFGFSPQYIRYEDIWMAVQCLKTCLQQKIWQQDKYRSRLPVT